MILRTAWGVFLAAMCLWSLPLFAAEISAHVNRNVITLNDTLELTLELSGQDETPDLGPLENNFTVLNSARSNRISIINGQIDRRNELVLTLAPKRDGELQIPPLAVGDKRTEPIIIKVVAAKAGTAGHDVLLEAAVDVRTVDVQAQLIYTLRVLHGVDLKEGALKAPDFPDAIVERLGEDTASEVLRDGRRYRVVERKYAVFPQKSGVFKIPAAEFTGKTAARGSSPFDSFFNRNLSADPFDQMLGGSQAVRARAKDIAVDVLPQPKNMQGSWWLPAKNIKLSEEWVPSPPQFRVGEPVTRTVMLEAEGLTAQQLPEVGQVDITGVKLYPDQPVKETATSPTGVTAKKTVKIALIATQPGQLQLPPVEVTWWDTRRRMQQVATLPAQVFEVLPAADMTGANAPALAVPQPPAASVDTFLQPEPFDEADSEASRQPNYWPYATAIAVAAWLLTTLAWWRSRGGRVSAVEEKPSSDFQAIDLKMARSTVHAACASRDPAQLRHALLQWAAYHWKDAPPRNLMDLAARVDDASLQEFLLRLEREGYAAQSEPVEIKPMSAAIVSWVDTNPEKVKKSAAKAGLKELYPE